MNSSGSSSIKLTFIIKPQNVRLSGKQEAIFLLYFSNKDIEVNKIVGFLNPALKTNTKQMMKEKFHMISYEDLKMMVKL